MLNNKYCVGLSGQKPSPQISKVEMTLPTVTTATGLRVIILSAVTVHYVPIMVWKGMTPQRAAFFLAAQAFLSLPAHVLFGWIADRVDKPRFMAMSMLLATVSMLVLLRGGSSSMLAIIRL